MTSCMYAADVAAVYPRMSTLQTAAMPIWAFLVSGAIATSCVQGWVYMSSSSAFACKAVQTSSPAGAVVELDVQRSAGLSVGSYSSVRTPGSSGHAAGTCKPCAFLHTKGSAIASFACKQVLVAVDRHRVHRSSRVHVWEAEAATGWCACAVIFGAAVRRLASAPSVLAPFEGGVAPGSNFTSARGMLEPIRVSHRQKACEPAPPRQSSHLPSPKTEKTKDTKYMRSRRWGIQSHLWAPTRRYRMCGSCAPSPAEDRRLLGAGPEVDSCRCRRSLELRFALLRPLGDEFRCAGQRGVPAWSLVDGECWEAGTVLPDRQVAEDLRRRSQCARPMLPRILTSNHYRHHDDDLHNQGRRDTHRTDKTLPDSAGHSAPMPQAPTIDMPELHSTRGPWDARATIPSPLWRTTPQGQAWHRVEPPSLCVAEAQWRPRRHRHVRLSRPRRR